MLDFARIDEALKLLAQNRRFRFNAHQVAYLSGNKDVNAVYDYLLTREPYILTRSFEILCPNQHAAKEYKSISQIPNRWLECRICGEEFRPDPDNISIVFDFTPSYLQSIGDLNQEKKRQRPVLI